jgi:hypothetical protein
MSGRTSDGHLVVLSSWDTQEQADLGFAAAIPDILAQAAAAGLTSPSFTVFEVQSDIRVAVPT